MHTHGIVFEGAKRGPEVRIVARSDVYCNLCLELGPSARLPQAENRDQRGSCPDKNELQDLVDDGRPQPAKHDVDGNRDCADPDGEADIPSEHNLHDQSHGVHINARHEDGHEGKTDRADSARTLTVAKLQIARDGVSFRDVVEGHHDDAKKEHGGNGADPVPVGCEHTVLVGGAGPSHQFERAKICRDEAESGDPGSHLATGKEKIFAGFGGAFDVEADEEDDHEIKDEDQDVDWGEMRELRGEQQGQGGHGFSIADGSLKLAKCDSKCDMDAYSRSLGSTSASLEAGAESSPNAK